MGRARLKGPGPSDRDDKRFELGIGFLSVVANVTIKMTKGLSLGMGFPILSSGGSGLVGPSEG